jgi:hypothetical protein
MITTGFRNSKFTRIFEIGQSDGLLGLLGTTRPRNDTAYGSNVEVFNLERMFLDKLAARFNIVPHKRRE